MTQDQFIKDVLQAAKTAGIEQAEAYAVANESMRMMVNKGSLDDYSVSSSGRLSLRGLVNGKMGTAYTEALDEAAIAMLVDNVLQSAALITDEDEQFIFAGSPAYEKVESAGDLGTPAQRIDLALALDQVGRNLNPLVQDLAYTMVQTIRQTVRIANTHGLDLAHSMEAAVAYVAAVARRDERVTTGGKQAAKFALSELSPEEIAGAAVEQAVFMLDAAPCESGARPVILNREAMSSLLAVFSGIFSAEAAQKGLSLLNGKEGETIAAPCVTLIDDPLMQGGFASQPFDGEGVATYTKPVIENGVLKTLLHNLKTAKKAGCASTGNATRGVDGGTVSVAPSNFFFQPGDKDLPALMAAMGNGLVITEVSGLHAGADAVSGDFSLLSEGYLVENGCKGRPVEQVTVAGNFFQLLKDIVEVGSDLVPEGDGVMSPSVWVRELSVAGK
ncbi:MAG: TldD/PmbA family protein [Oscillospiraceae bacterium]|jgi:PmbA protein|nr:TldD/PmbA family protein [Oscillospiraceae bacterium]